MMNFVVVGGGSAGWLTALFVKKHVPYSTVTVIASSEIGILGAGEGTTPHFIDFLKDIDVPVSGVIKHAKGTIKNGIKFTNWNGDNEHYYHPFWDNFDSSNIMKTTTHKDIMPLYLDKIARNENLDEILLTNYISEKNQVKYRKDDLKNFGGYALHFDANLLAKYLQTVGLERGITLVDDEVVGIDSDTKGNITGFNLKSGNYQEAGFVFDCSGFKRLIIGEFYKTPWISYSETLPVNRAMPFFVETDSTEVPPYTESIAMKYGWMWKIPVQGRFGCGYVFDSNLATDDQIKEELTEYLGYEPTIPRVFSFNAGVYDNTWVKNCIAVGLSSGFTEPLEATSIWVTTAALRGLAKRLDAVITKNPKVIEGFNFAMKKMNEGVLDFIYFHYISKRTDTEFWTNFAENNKATEFVKRIKDISRKTIPKAHDFNYIDQMLNQTSEHLSQIPFSDASWHYVGAGTRFFKSSIAEKDLSNYKDIDVEQIRSDLVSLIETTSSELFDHYQYLEYLKNNDN